MKRRACDQCLGTDTQRECEQGQCYAEHSQQQEAERHCHEKLVAELVAKAWQSTRYGKVKTRREDHVCSRAADRITAQAAEIERLREALAFYRDGFEPFVEHKHLPGFAWRPKEVLLEDCGETARAALNRSPTDLVTLS